MRSPSAAHAAAWLGVGGGGLIVLGAGLVKSLESVLRGALILYRNGAFETGQMGARLFDAASTALMGLSPLLLLVILPFFITYLVSGLRDRVIAELCARYDAGLVVMPALDAVRLGGFGDRRPGQLSGGQQQRVALARSLAKSPKLLLLDEPMGALDKKLRSQMQLELVNIVERLGVTCVMVTHDQEEAMTMADRIAVMNQGRIEQLGTPTELYETPSTAYVAGFLGVSNLIPGTVSGPDTVRLRSGQEVRVKRDALGGRTGSVAVGIRPEKIELGDGQVNTLDGKVVEQAYVGVATQYIVDTDCGRLTVYRQNASPGLNGAAPGQPITLSWSPDCAFVVDSMEGSE